MTNGRTKSTKIVVWTLVCFLGIWLVYLEAANLMAWHFAHKLSRNHPNLALLPGSLPDVGLAELEGPRIDRFGFSFQIPWKLIDKQRDWRTATVVYSRDGAALIVFDPSIAVDGAKAIRGTGRQRKKVTAVLGAQAFNSNYALMAAEIEATPAQVKWWGMFTSNARNLILVSSKLGSIDDWTTAIYPLHFGALQGFQFGDPAVAPYSVKLDLFDGNDRHYKIWISSNDRLHQVLSQAQVNAFVNSIRPLPSTIDLAPSN